MKHLSILAPLLQLATAIQPSAKDPARDQELRELKWGQINFLHTTDNHGWHAGHLQESQYSADLGDYFSFISRMREQADKRNVDLLVLDTGDRGEGNGLWDASDPMGSYTRKLLQQLDVDLLTTGNHELYNKATAENEFREMVPFYEGRYLASNVDINIDGQWQPMANRTLKFTTKNQGLKIVTFGFVFNFTRNYNNTRVTMVNEAIEQDWFKTAISDTDVDIFLVMGHIPVNGPEFDEIHDAIRAVHPDTIIQMFGGHTHIRDFKIFDKKSTAIESGRYCETVGWLSINGIPEANHEDYFMQQNTSTTFFRRYLDSNRPGFQHHSGTNDSNFDTSKGLRLSAEIVEYRNKLNLDRLIGCAPKDFFLTRAAYPGPDNWYSFIQEEVLPTVVYREDRKDVPRVIYINTGSQRFDVFKGPFTYDTTFIVSPFTSKFVYLRDVDWEIVSQLKGYFESDTDPYIYMAPPEMQAEILRKHSKRGIKPTRNQVVLEQKENKYHKVLGYTTEDDAGRTGDDTVHLQFEEHPIPKVIQANASFPTNSAPEKVDVIFFDFIGVRVLEGLNQIGGGQSNYGNEDVQAYMSSEDTMTKLLLDYIGEKWGKDC